jgi:aminobenzoyl-glutamate utilization protein A
MTAGDRDRGVRALREAAAARLDALRALRRDLHRHAETGWTEFRTSGLVARELARHGYRVLRGHECVRPDAILGAPPAAELTRRRREAGELGADVELPGVVGILERGPGPTVALRFDMDATEVLEAEGGAHRPAVEGFASTRPGAMHACGHDGHVAIGLGVAELLARPDLPWRGRVKLVFQPAEEGGRGAHPMVEAGIVDDVDHFAALHIGHEALGLGQVALEVTHFLSSAKLDAEWQGVAAHAAGAPERGRNALLAACHAVLGLHALPRHGGGATFVNAGVLRAGTGRNVVPSVAELRFEVRGETDQICAGLEAAARQVVEGAAQMHGVEVAIRAAGRTIGARSDPGLVARLGALVAACPGELEALPSFPLGGGEDATLFMRRVQARGGQALYFLLGADARSGHHSATFDFDERALGHGVALMTGLVLDLLG